MNIIQALATGFTVDQVLDLLNAKYPHLSGKLKSAQKAGYDVQKFMRSLQGATKKDLFSMEQKAKNSPNPLISAQATARENSAQTFLKDKALPALGAVAAAGLGAYGTSKLAPRAAQAIGGLFGGSQQPPPSTPPSGPGPTPSPGIGPAPMGNAPVQPSPIPPAGQANVAAAAGAIQPPASPQPQPQQPLSPQKQRATQFLQNLGVEDRVKELAAKGRTPEQIASDIQMEMHPQTRKAYNAKRTRGEEIPIAHHVKEYLTDAEGLLDHGLITPQRKLVATPDGVIGTIKSEKEKQALVESDGKLHKANREDLIESPLPEKDTIALFDELNAQIEKESGEEISKSTRMVYYDPEKKSLLYIPWGGVPYDYDDLDDEEIKWLDNHTQERRTSGESPIGPWIAGTKSVFGSKMFDFIKGLQAKRGGKGNEYATKFRELLYDPTIFPYKKKKEAMRKRK